MIYKDFHRHHRLYIEAQAQLAEIIGEKEVLFARTQPSAIRYDKVRITGGEPTNAYDEYLAAKEKLRIDERIKEARDILAERSAIRQSLIEELKASHDIKDRIYYLKYIEGRQTGEIAKKVGYSKAQICRIQKMIQNDIK